MWRCDSVFPAGVRLGSALTTCGARRIPVTGSWFSVVSIAIAGLVLSTSEKAALSETAFFYSWLSFVSSFAICRVLDLLHCRTLRISLFDSFCPMVQPKPRP